MKIAICDDDQFSLDVVKGMITSCETMIPNIEIYEFTSGKDLVESHKIQKQFNLILLDIEMPEYNGLQIGNAIRKIDNNVAIVFLTSHKQYVFKSFRLKVFDYMVKPITMDGVANLLLRVYKEYKEQHCIIDVKWQGQSNRLNVNDIVYIEGYSRHVMFHTITKSYECVGKMNDYEKMLLSYGFLRCHQGFIVNMKYIKSVEKEGVIMTTGAIIEMSVRKRKECIDTLSKYFEKHQI